MAKLIRKYGMSTDPPSQKGLPNQTTGKQEENPFPAYPVYPPEEDIYYKDKKEGLNPEDPSKMKSPPEKPGKLNEKDFEEDVTGGDLDVPGPESDEEQMGTVSEDEENEYFSLGGDDHDDLDEDKGE